MNDGSANTADHICQPGASWPAFVVRTLPPEGAKWPLGALRRALGRQMANKTAPETLLAALGPLLMLLRAVSRPGGPREGSGGPGKGLIWDVVLVVKHKMLEKAPKSVSVVDLSIAFLDRVLTLKLSIFLLAWHAPGEEANIDKS